MIPDMPAPDAAAELRSNTIKVVQYILRLRLSRARWDRVTEIIEAATAAAAADDLQGLRKATDELMLVSPVRVIKGDAVPAEPARQKIFERVNVLIDTLQSMQPASTDDADGEGR